MKKLFIAVLALAAFTVAYAEEDLDALIAQKLQAQKASATQSSPFHQAAAIGDTVKVNEFIKLGKDVNIQDTKGVTALMEAADKGHNDVVNLLLKKGANPNLQNNNKATALMRAANAGHKDVVATLIKGKADVNIENKLGNTALYFAVANGHTDIVKQLLSAKANPNLTNSDGDTPLLYAIKNKKSDVAVVLIESGKVDVNAEDSKGNRPIEWAYAKADQNVITALTKRGAKFNPKSPLSQMLLAVSPMFVDEKLWMLRHMLEEGVDPVTATDDQGNTAIVNAIAKGNIGAVDVLLAAGVDINKRVGPWNNPPLFYALYNPEMLQHLINKGADVNVYSAALMTPLEFATNTVNINNINEQIVEILIKAGANPNKRGKTLYSALQRVEKNITSDKESKLKRKRLIKLLKDAEKTNQRISLTEDERALLDAAVQNDKQKVLELADKGTNFWILDAKAKNQNSPFVILNRAINEQDSDFILKMREKGVTLDFQYGLTPLTSAAFQCDLPRVKFILKMGANKYIREYNEHRLGDSALTRAMDSRKGYCSAVVSFLQEQGLTLSKEDKALQERHKQYEQHLKQAKEQAQQGSNTSIADTFKQGLFDFGKEATNAAINQGMNKYK